MQEKQKKLVLPPPVMALMVYGLLVFTVIYTLKHFTLLAAPVLFSLVIAYLFNPLVNFLVRKTPVPRSLVAAVLMILLVFIFIFLIINLLPYVIDQASFAAEKLPQILETFSRKAQVANSYLAKNFPDYLGTIDIMGRVEKMIGMMLTDLTKILGGIFSSLYGFVIMLIYLVFVPLFSYYFIKDYYVIKASLLDLIPLRSRQYFMRKLVQMDHIFSSFIRGQAIVVLILAVLYSLGLSLIGLPFAILIGIFSGLGDIVPYVGTVLGVILSVIIGFAHFQSAEKLLLIFLVYGAVKGLENWFFYPKIVGSEVGLHFVWVLTSIIVFGQLFGFWGLLVSIPVAAGLKVFLSDLVEHYKRSGFYQK